MKNVFILGTIHAAHMTNPSYSLQHILEKVKKISPEILCVEIREQDMIEPNSYLKEHYPPEMVFIKECYEGQIPVFGFDWRGNAMERRRIGDRPSDSKDIFQLMQEDSFVHELIIRQKLQMKSFFDSCTLDSCQLHYSANYDKIKSMDEELNEYLYKRGFQELVEYNIEREQKICQNLKKIVTTNDGKHLMIITGISHRAKIEVYFNQEL